MPYTLTQKMRGWLAIRPNGDNDKFFTDHDKALAYVTALNGRKEIERRWLVRGPIPENPQSNALLIHQMYLSQPEGSDAVVRVRQTQHREATTYHLTVKQEITHGVCGEEEIEIPYLIYNALADRAVSSVSKQRWYIPYGDHTIHLDRIDTEGDSLWIAEIELPSMDTIVMVPEWFGEEITGRREYSNFALARPWRGNV